MKVLNKPKYSVTIDAFSLRKFNYLLFDKNYHQEFTAFFYCDRDGDSFHFSDIFFPTQENNSTKTEVDGEAIIELEVQGVDLGRIRGHAHSHVNMTTTPSQTDLDEIVERAGFCSYNVALILNKKGDMFAHIADSEKNIYSVIEDIEVAYPFSREEFEAYVLSSVREAETLKEVEEILEYTEWNMFQDMYPMEEEAEKELDEIKRTKFKYLYSPISTFRPNTSSKKKEFLSKKEIERFKELDKKTISQMTDKEYNEWDYLYNLVIEEDTFFNSGISPANSLGFKSVLD